MGDNITVTLTAREAAVLRHAIARHETYCAKRAAELEAARCARSAAGYEADANLAADLWHKLTRGG